jgi:HEAT repeat protein
LRFQAQYLRRIRLPRWQDVPEATRTALIEAARAQDRLACNAAVSALYHLSEEEQAAIAAGKQGASNGNKPV